MKALFAAESVDEVPKVVQEKRRQDRNHLLGLVILLGLVGACTVYMVIKLGLSTL